MENELTPEAYEALGWMLAECCSNLDKGLDIRKMEISEIIERAEIELIKSKNEK